MVHLNVDMGLGAEQKGKCTASRILIFTFLSTSIVYFYRSGYWDGVGLLPVAPSTLPRTLQWSLTCVIL